MIRRGVVPSAVMTRSEERLFRLSDEISRLREEIRLTVEELRIHQHLDDDARRDASVGGPIEREDARDTSADVARFQRLLDELERRAGRLEEKRQRLLSRLA
jgi:ribosome-associated translation inhibitor RaiA